ncbi:uncharacterized protein LOC102804675 [Saccoglossus kowalevskii]|uniref:RNA helicase n=1 Tax=Saccoglossus kowalevskii TaxID=10224 RepID=A0ABM0MMI7_SACKO|nr:PREDICTED: probable ATP-dependent RNA helicase DDX20-like [Saccoglossus kowalevskii]
MASIRTAHNISQRQRTSDVLLSENIDFAGLLLSDAVQQGLSNAGFEKPSPIQLKAIPLGRCGLDLIVQAKSGTGKTCVFSVISLESLHLDSSSTQVLVLAPTREIAVQIQDVILSIGSAISQLRCHVFIGGLPLAQDKIKLHKCHIAVGTPGRIKQLIEEDLLHANTIRLFILDEADKLLEENFQEQINWIYSSLPENKQMLALSATYPEYLAQQLTSYMRDPVFVRLNPKDLALQGLVQYYELVPHHALPHKQFEVKVQHLLKLFSQVSFNQCLVFSNYQTRAQNLSDQLCHKGWPSTYISGSQDQTQRLQAMSMLKNFKCRVLISTDLTARGIDAEKVNLVINLDVPFDSKTYLHRIGRAGRFGTQGIAVTYAAHGTEEQHLRAIEKECFISMKPLPDIISSNLIQQEHGNFTQSQSVPQSTPQINGNLQEFTLSGQTSSKTDANNASVITKSLDVKENMMNKKEHCNSIRKATSVAKKDDDNKSVCGSKSHKCCWIGQRNVSDNLVTTAEFSCQTERIRDYDYLGIGKIQPVSMCRVNKVPKMKITYENALKDFEDFLVTDDTNVESWMRFYVDDDCKDQFEALPLEKKDPKCSTDINADIQDAAIIEQGVDIALDSFDGHTNVADTVIVKPICDSNNALLDEEIIFKQTNNETLQYYLEDPAQHGSVQSKDVVSEESLHRDDEMHVELSFRDLKISEECSTLNSESLKAEDEEDETSVVSEVSESDETQTETEDEDDIEEEDTSDDDDEEEYDDEEEEEEEEEEESYKLNSHPHASPQVWEDANYRGYNNHTKCASHEMYPYYANYPANDYHPSSQNAGLYSNDRAQHLYNQASYMHHYGTPPPLPPPPPPPPQWNHVINSADWYNEYWYQTWLYWYNYPRQ